MGDTVSVYLRYTGSTAMAAGAVMGITGGATCFYSGDSVEFRANLSGTSTEGWVHLDLSALSQKFDREDLVGTALEPYTHEIVVWVGGVSGDDYWRIATERGRQTYERLQRWAIPLLLADEDARAYADYLPGREPRDRCLPAGTLVEPEYSAQWTSELYLEPSRFDRQIDQGIDNPVVAFAISKQVFLAPCLPSGVPTAPAFGILPSDSSANLLREIVEAARKMAIDTDPAISESLYETIAYETRHPIQEIIRAPKVYVENDGADLLHYL